MQPSPPRYDHLIRAQASLSDPHRTRQVDRQAAAGELIRLRAGVFRRAEESPTDARRPSWQLTEAAALDRILAVAVTRRTPVVLSHRSAAMIWKLPLLGPAPSVVDLLEPPTARRSSKRGVRVHRLEGEPTDVVPWGDFAVTSFERTLADAAREFPAWQSIPMLDQALAATVDETEAEERRRRVLEIALRSRTTRGIRRAAFAIAFADRRAASPGESVTRLLLHEFGSPAPALQQPHLVSLAFARRVYSDLEWPDLMKILEFDGMQKYFDPEMLNGLDPREALSREKLREDALRALGFAVVRAVWDDLRVPRRLYEKVVAAGIPVARRSSQLPTLW